VTILDVGQGSGAYIKTDDGFEVLVDVGETNKTLRVLGSIRPWWDNHIDLMIISHADKDHAGMAPRILRRFKISNYIESPKISQDGLSRTIRDELVERKVNQMKTNPLDTITISENTTLTFLSPSSSEANELNDNDASVIFILSMYGKKFLFMGDASAEIEKELAHRYSTLLDVDVLIVGHHGSKTSTSEDFLKVVNPEYAVISLGQDNRYGHPHASVLDRLEKRGVSLLRTDTHGTIQFRIKKEDDFDIVTK